MTEVEQSEIEKAATLAKSTEALENKCCEYQHLMGLYESHIESMALKCFSVILRSATVHHGYRNSGKSAFIWYLILLL
jgi:hypothetical protein